ncbi:MAG: hypothetical protein LQ351_000662 [Letrouitia transgressa]|nr:MAG: hypothetical protein LQ351_000662 [Letrouitia transgressa]
MTFGYTYTYISLLAFDRVTVDEVLFTSESISSSTAIKFLCIGLLWYFYTAAPMSTTKATKPTLRRLLRTLSPASFLLFSLVLSSRFLTNVQRPSLNGHPIDLLIIKAEEQHATWLDKASASRTLQECVEEYHRRYKRQPPPGFDTWYKYATERSSVVIDDYDNMMEDLLPFWALKPAEIRKATSDILSDSWNEVAEITIRSGKPEIGPDVKPTHRWMLDGVIAMLSNFKDKLPDMDLAFNINDEPRVAIPFDDLDSLRKDAQSKDTVGKIVLNQFTGNRSNGWQRANHQDPNLSSLSSHPFEDHSFLPSFHNFGSISCPPAAHARTAYLWDSRDLCHKCFAPHSQGLFLSNWTLSASPCHQPDLAHLHGFYLSPAAFKPSKRLVPVFSQSKAQGYADILYPSPWNYKDKVKYDPSNDTGPYPDLSFVKKENTLFWRGATSEGLSRWGTWKSMMRQRFVHMMSDLPKDAKIPILLPDPKNEGNFAYQKIPQPLFQQLGLRSSVSFVSSIARCWDSDCQDQKAEFALPGPTDFQAHWGHRYLMDLDGAGFSGRFIPFLQSRSLPFKAALFREWWEGRVTAWKHFVPVDLRLWGMWSTLAYFEGTNNILNEEGRWTLRGMEEKTDVGGKMAREGREWADKVLRKEDMEVYLYRLLLEWARLTDDRRDEIGFMG